MKMRKYPTEKERAERKALILATLGNGRMTAAEMAVKLDLCERMISSLAYTTGTPRKPAWINDLTFTPTVYKCHFYASDGRKMHSEFTSSRP
jgi:hypothetical protein